MVQVQFFKFSELSDFVLLRMLRNVFTDFKPVNDYLFFWIFNFLLSKVKP